MVKTANLRTKSADITGQSEEGNLKVYRYPQQVHCCLLYEPLFICKSDGCVHGLTPQHEKREAQPPRSGRVKSRRETFIDRRRDGGDVGTTDHNPSSFVSLYISWCDPTTASEISRPRYSSPYPWPLNTVLAYRKQWDVQNQLKALGWYSKSLEEVYDEVDNCCKALSQRLGNHHYFFKQGPTELDALVFGHLYTILTTPLTDNCLADIVKEYGNLINFCRHIEKKFFEERERGPKE
ncbi:Metaxin-2 [Branchiostoma belcheri]|nr:Metaxin-2 [Branchiostoma belcheri]